VAGERGDRADVVEVRVREQDRLDAVAEVLERFDQALRLVTRIDHDRLRGAVARGEEAVLGDRADGEAVDVHRRQRPFDGCCLLKRLYIQLSNA
jgi:hypothetical protein